jgi:chitinase
MVPASSSRASVRLMRRIFRLRTLLVLAAFPLFGCGASSPTVTTTTGPNPPTPSYTVAGYYPEWGLYDSTPFVPKNLVSNGTAPLLTHLIYAFATINNNQCALADTYADYQDLLPASEAISGVADTGPFAGNLHQLQELKALYPNLQIMVSIGGGAMSPDVFSVAAEPANVNAFVTSCINLFINGRFASGITEPGIFTGIDIDWEFPGQGTVNTPSTDQVNYTAMMQEFRSQLDAINPNYLLTTTAPAGSWAWQYMNFGAVQNSVNFLNVMNYDFDGPWSTTTGFVAPLYQSSSDPSNTNNAGYVVQSYLDMGVPKNKIVFGMPFYAYEWGAVTDQNDGLFEPCTADPSTGECPNNTYEYNQLTTLTGYSPYRDAVTGEPWLWDGNSTFITYDDPTSLGFKAQFVARQDLRGIMIWELSGDTTSGSLIQALTSNLSSSASTTSKE